MKVSKKVELRIPAQLYCLNVAWKASINGFYEDKHMK